jgi:hypothetical protein
MKLRKLGLGVLRRSTALFICLALVAGAVPSASAQTSTAALAGVILDPAGLPASGFKVVIRDVASNKTFVSDPSDAQGNYSAQVPLGGRYKIDRVIADDGVTSLPVQDTATVSTLTAGTTRLNVRFTTVPVPASQTAGTTPAGDDKKKSKAGTPWYHRPGPIVGIVLGSAAVVALAVGAGGSSSSSNASPSAPPVPAP